MRAIVLLWMTGCAAESQWYGYAGEDSWTTPPGIPLQLRVSKLDKPNTIAVVTMPPSAESPSGPADAGTRLPVTLDGIACEVAVMSRTSDTVERSRSAAEERRAPGASAGTRTIRGLNVHISCGGEPVPGTDASLRGAHARTSILWAALPLLLGIAAGELVRRRKQAALAVGLLAVFGSVPLALGLFEGMFAVNYLMLFAALAMIGIIGMRGDSRKFRIASIAGCVVGTAIAPLIWPVWNGFGPIMALLLALLVGASATAAVMLKKG